jgi:Fe-S oxidoreductase
VSKYSPRHKIHKNLLEQPEDAKWKCLTCGLCSEYCPQEVEYLNFVRDSRQSTINKTGKIGKEIVAHKSIFTLIPEFMNKFQSAGIPLDFSGQTDKSSKTGYFPGCIDFFDCFLDVGVNFHKIGESSIKLMNNIGIKPKLISMRCCGHDMLWQGNKITFEKLKEFNTRYLEKSGIETLIVSCAECYRTFSMDYDLKKIKVLHISQLLDQNIDKLKMENKTKITFHDPCRLGRHMGVYEAPRNILRSVNGLELKELEESGKKSQCCGVSAWLSCNTESKSIMVNKLDMAIRTGAQTLVTACPKCLAHLSCLKNEKPPIKDFPIDIKDLTVFMAELIKT